MSTREMLGLSARQPWAWLLVHGYKPLENRSRRTRYRGPFYVHASLQVDVKGYAWVQENFPEIDMPALRDMPRGGIVGVAELATVVSESEPLEPFYARWRMGGFGWIVKNASPLPFKPMRGMLGFFKAEQ